MSTTYSLVCKKCKKSLWVGQRNYIYKGEKYIEKLEQFLYNHINHDLMFVNDSAFELDEYEEIEE